MKKLKKDEVYEVAYLTTSGVKGSQTMTGAEILKMEAEQAKGMYNILQLLSWKEYTIKIKEDE